MGRICKIHRRGRDSRLAGPAAHGRDDARVYHRRRDANAGSSDLRKRLAGEGNQMLTREQLTDDQWRTVRNTPHLVAIAVSTAGGSLFDEMLERSAAMSGIVDALNSRHPLVQGIAASADIMAAQDQVRSWYHSLEDSERHAATLQAKALAMFKDAVGTLQERGQHDDVRLYCDFVIALATRVARTAREGDMLGFGGELVSSGERAFIALLEAAMTTNGR